MADSKISGLTADTTPTSDDLVVTVNDPAGTPGNRQVTLANLFTNNLAGAATNQVATSETTTSASYTDLATSGPAVTVTIGNSGKALVVISGKQENNTAGQWVYMSVAVSGASTVAASDAHGMQNSNSVTAINSLHASRMMLLTGLTAGSNTFTTKYRVTAGTGTWVNRDIIVIPL